MSNNLKMFGRYGLAIAVGYLVGAGKITPEAGDLITKVVTELAGLLVAFAPAIYAALKVDNTPKS